MMSERRDRCRRLAAIEGNLIDRALNLYEGGKMVDFWDSVDALASLGEVVDKVCGRGSQ